MKKLIFQKFLKDAFISFMIIGFSISLIIWVIQAVNFLDFVTDDGHSLAVYFSYTLFSLPKIIHRILPFVFFVSLFFTIAQYELKNELIIYWNNGVNKITFINIIIIYSIFILIFQLIMSLYASPFSQNKARTFLRDSNVDFFPSLIRPGKFIDTVSKLTIFIESKDEQGFYKNIFLYDSIDDGSDSVKKNKSQEIHAKKGTLINQGTKKIFVLYDGKITNIQNGNVNNFKFEKIEFDLTKYSSKTTIYPKVQEAPSRDIFNCVYYNYKKELLKFNAEYLRCEVEIINDIHQEFLKRFFKPLYIPLIALVSSLLIIISKESKNFSYFKMFLFFSIFFLIVISEVSLRYVGHGESRLLAFILIPVLIFSTVYILLITKFRNLL